ncbi:MAG: hypothetical protein Q9223_007533 [Gallowayella weberi]
MSRNDTYLSLCLEQASLSPLHYRHGCIVVRGGKVIGKGYNDYRSGFNGDAQMTGSAGSSSNPAKYDLKSKKPKAYSNKSSETYVAFNCRDHAVGTGGGALANTPLSMHSEMMAINSALSLSSAIACQGTARSTHWLQKPCFKLSSRSKRRARLQLLKAYSDAICQNAVEQATALEGRGGYNNVQQQQEEEGEQEQQQQGTKKNMSKRQNPGNNSVHHHLQTNYLEFQKANAQKALRQLTSDDNEKHRKQYLYGISDTSQYHHHHHHSHHEKQKSSTHPQQKPHEVGAILVPQSRIVTKSHQVAERMKDPRLNGADLYVARLGKKGHVNHYDCGCRYDKHTAKSPGTEVVDSTEPSPRDSTSSPQAKLPMGSLHEELRFPSSTEKDRPISESGSKSELLTATHSRPCYRCISYMHSAGIKRVFWTNNKGEWEGGKVRDLVDSLEAPLLPSGDGTMGGAGSIYVTKSEVMMLKGLK